ncbi:uncharacterized protein LOC141634415 isoform X1 [Silene latifolia]|uniref:uncharacterized protein LOC141634415 isoform X1 n=1 Tax=Silene latifolia TaxID=37657 RepID=UPI003D77807C
MGSYGQNADLDEYEDDFIDGVGPSKYRYGKHDEGYDGFGSFLGPLQPVIAGRVVQESKALLETRHLAPKASTSQNNFLILQPHRRPSMVHQWRTGEVEGLLPSTSFPAAKAF